MNKEQIFALRTAIGESQEQFARRVGVSVGAVSRWERGVSVPRRAYADALRYMAHVVGVEKLDDAQLGLLKLKWKLGLS